MQDDLHHVSTDLSCASSTIGAAAPDEACTPFNHAADFVTVDDDCAVCLERSDQQRGYITVRELEHIRLQLGAAAKRASEESARLASKASA
jgi:hypothetical protein